MKYIDRIQQQNVRVDLALAPAVGGVDVRRQGVSRVRVAPEDARSWRVVLAPLVITEPFAGSVLDFTSGVPNKPRARITYGADGVSSVVDVDWPVGGAMLSAWGDSVQVDGIIPDTWITGALPASVALACTIQPDASGGGLRATRSVYSGLVLGGGVFSAGIPVPAGARAWRWHQSINLSAGNTPCPITWYAVMDAGLAVAVQTTPSGIYTSSESTWPSDDGITLSPDARFILFSNDSGGGGLPPPPFGVSLTVEFCLDLG